MIPTPLDHLRHMQMLRANIPNNPYHNQHIMEFTQYMEETVQVI